MENTITDLVDDPSLEAASSIIRFRKTSTTSRVYQLADSQFVIEDDVDRDGQRILSTRHLVTTGMSVKALRATYTLVSLFFVS